MWMTYWGSWLWMNNSINGSELVPTMYRSAVRHCKYYNKVRGRGLCSQIQDEIRKHGNCISNALGSRKREGERDRERGRKEEREREIINNE